MIWVTILLTPEIYTENAIILCICQKVGSPWPVQKSAAMCIQDKNSIRNTTVVFWVFVCVKSLLPDEYIVCGDM